MEAILLQIGSSITNAVESKFNTFVELSPFILGALAVFFFGWVLAEVSSRAILGLGHKIHLETISEKLGLKHFLELRKSKFKPTQVIAKGVKGYLIFLFFVEATKIAQLTQVAEFLTTVINFIPQVIIALFIMLIGIRIGNTLQNIITTSLSFTKSNTAHVLGYGAKYTVFTFAVLAALAQIQIAEILIQVLFIGFIAFLTVAGGLAFGLGGKELVAELLEDIKRVEVKEIRKEIREDLKSQGVGYRRKKTKKNK